MLRRWVVFAALLIVSAGAGSAAALAQDAALVSPTARCTVRLDVDVWGGPVTWAAQAGLTTGQEARLRARATPDCTIYLITGEPVGRPDAKLLKHHCGGSPCFWRVASSSAQAVDFQAHALPTDLGDCKPDGICSSNVVRVAWTGTNRIVGTWKWYFAPPRDPLVQHGTVAFSKDRRARWSGGNDGDWLQDGPNVTIRWQNGAVDTLKVSGDGRTMTGKSSSGDRVKGVRL